MRTSTAEANDWKCPECGDDTTQDRSDQGYVRHRSKAQCDFQRGERDG